MSILLVRQFNWSRQKIFQHAVNRFEVGASVVGRPKVNFIFLRLGVVLEKSHLRAKRNERALHVQLDNFVALHVENGIAERGIVFALEQGKVGD